MAGTKISALTDGTTAAETDRIPICRDPSGTPLNRYISPAYIKDYILGLANTWSAEQTITPAANTSALVVSGFSLTGSNAQSLLSLAGTWNTSGTPTALDLDMLDTASNAAALLMNLKIGGASRFRVTKAGAAVLANSIVITESGSNLYFMTTGGAAVPFGNGNSATIGGSNGVPGGGQAINVASTWAMAWANGSNWYDTKDTALFRDAAGILAQRANTTAQGLRVYYTWTNSSNHQRAAINTAAANIELAAETAGTGADDIDVKLTPAGTGVVQFGSHSAVAAETVTGFITIKDAAGNARKLAVLS